MRGSSPWAAWRSILGGCDGGGCGGDSGGDGGGGGGGGDASNIPELSSTWLYLLLMSIKKLKLQASF